MPEPRTCGCHCQGPGADDTDGEETKTASARAGRLGERLPPEKCEGFRLEANGWISLLLLVIDQAHVWMVCLKGPHICGECLGWVWVGVFSGSWGGVEQWAHFQPASDRDALIGQLIIFVLPWMKLQVGEIGKNMSRTLIHPHGQSSDSDVQYLKTKQFNTDCQRAAWVEDPKGDKGIAKHARLACQECCSALKLGLPT